MDGAAVLGKVVAPALEGTAGAEYGTEIAEAATKNEHLECCKIVEEPTHAHYMAKL